MGSSKFFYHVLVDIISFAVWYGCVLVRIAFLPTKREHESMKGNLGLALRESWITMFFNGIFQACLIFGSIIWVASKFSCNYLLSSGAVGVLGRRKTGQTRVSEKAYIELFYFHKPVFFLALHWVLVFGTFSTSCYYLVGPQGRVIGNMLGYFYGLLYLLPRAVRRWTGNHSSSSARTYISLLFRCLLVGVPLSIANDMIISSLLDLYAPDTISFLYPLLISFAEFVMISIVLHDGVMVVHSDVALAIMVRFATVLIEGLRVGMLVMIANTVGSLRGLQSAVFMSAVLEALAKNNLIELAFRGALIIVTGCGRTVFCRGSPSKERYPGPTRGLSSRYPKAGGADRGDADRGEDGGRHNRDTDAAPDEARGIEIVSSPLKLDTAGPGADDAEQTTLPSPPASADTSTATVDSLLGSLRSLTKLPRFKRVYLGCKVDAQYWVVFGLILMKLTEYGSQTSLDIETGKLDRSLVCGWDVIVVLLCGELFGDLLAVILKRVIAHYYPSLSVAALYIPTGRSALFRIAMVISLGSVVTGTVGGYAVLGRELSAAAAADKLSGAVSPPSQR